MPPPDQRIQVRNLSTETGADVAAHRGGVFDREFGADDLLIQPVHVPGLPTRSPCADYASFSRQSS